MYKSPRRLPWGPATEMRRTLWLLLALTVWLVGPASVGARAAGPEHQAFLPLVQAPAESLCAPIAGQTYGTLPVYGPPTDRPAAMHPDLNLSLRGYVPTTAYLGLIDVAGELDPLAPQLRGLFSDGRTPQFVSVFRVYDWDWVADQRAAPLDDPPVTLAGLRAAEGELLFVPDSGYQIGGGYEVLVLYASSERITLKYTRDDNVVAGYTLQLEGICVEPTLLALYEAWDAAGRGQLPALRAGQPLGRARASEVRVAIRDTGRFLDPRSRKDWWH